MKGKKKKHTHTHTFLYKDHKSSGGVLQTLKRYERQNDNKNCAKKPKPMFKSFASSHKSPFCRPTNLKTWIDAEGQEGQGMNEWMNEFIYLFIYWLCIKTKFWPWN